MKPRIIIFVEGGIVQWVAADLDVDVDCVVIDRDDDALATPPVDYHVVDVLPMVDDRDGVDPAALDLADIVLETAGADTPGGKYPRAVNLPCLGCFEDVPLEPHSRLCEECSEKADPDDVRRSGGWAPQ